MTFCLVIDCRRSIVRFVDGVGVLDVYHDGLSPYLLMSQHLNAIPTIKQQTARWPGFYDSVRSMIALGLLDEGILSGATSSPIDQVHDILVRNGRLARNRPDISLVEVVAELISGERTTLRIISRFDKETGLTGMAQLTSFLAAWTARRVADIAASCKPGLTLSHEFYDRDTTRELLLAYQKHVKCTVSSSSQSHGVTI